MTPQVLKERMEAMWANRGVMHASSRTAWAFDRAGSMLVPRAGRPTGMIRLPRRYLPLYRQPRLGLPKRPRSRKSTAH